MADVKAAVTVVIVLVLVLVGGWAILSARSGITAPQTSSSTKASSALGVTFSELVSGIGIFLIVVAAVLLVFMHPWSPAIEPSSQDTV